MPAKGVGVKAILVAGGDAVPGDAALLRDVDLVIAADSGAEWLDEQRRSPDVLVGDLDSIDPGLLERLTAQGVAIERHEAEKDASDATPDIAGLQENYNIGTVDWAAIDASGTSEQTLQQSRIALDEATRLNRRHPL
jgi:thiamine pyrophosphokinase